MQSSLAFLVNYTKDIQEADKANVKLHFNLWDLYTEKDKKETFLDVGVYIKDIKNIKEFLIYFPFHIKNNEFIDLHSCFRTDSELVRTIFNHNLSFNSVSNSLSYISYDSKGTTDDFFVHTLPFESAAMLAVNHQNYAYNGDGLNSTLFTMTDTFLECVRGYQETAVEAETTNAAYFRFRVPLKDRSVFISAYEPKHSFITGALNKNEIIDFRVNESRSLPSGLYNEKESRRMSFVSDSIDYFLVKDAWCEYQGSHSGFKKSRTLEKSFWLDYLIFKSNNENLRKALKNDEPIVIYHWQKTKN